MDLLTKKANPGQPDQDRPAANRGYPYFCI